jgi:hypothetical protein
MMMPAFRTIETRGLGAGRVGVADMRISLSVVYRDRARRRAVAPSAVCGWCVISFLLFSVVSQWPGGVRHRQRRNSALHFPWQFSEAITSIDS